MLRLLLDIHIPPSVAAGVRARRPNCTIQSLRDWRDRAYRAEADADILAAAYEEGMTLVTYDQDIVPSLLQRWAATDRPHAGVVLVDQRTVRSHDIGTLVRSLVSLWDRRGHEDWTNVVGYLERPPEPN